MPTPVPCPSPGHLPWSGVDLRLRATRSAWLSTTRPDGRPHSAPVWFVWDDGHAWFVTGTSLQKARNLRHEPWAVLSAGDGDEVVVLEGPTRVVDDEAERSTVDAAYAAKYVDPASGAQAGVRAADVDLWRIDVRHVMAWVYGDITGRTDWRFDGW